MLHGRTSICLNSHEEHVEHIRLVLEVQRQELRSTVLHTTTHIYILQLRAQRQKLVIKSGWHHRTNME